MSSRVAQNEYARVMAMSGPERFQGLVRLVRLYTDFGPGWAALAEEHWAGRRREEALQAARRALAVDPGLHQGFSLELKMASRPLLAQVAPKQVAPKQVEPKQVESPAASAPRRVLAAHRRPIKPDPVAIARGQMLESALSLGDVDDRVDMLRELETLAPEDPEILFHVAKELAVAGRMEEARVAGEKLNQHAPDRYVALYDWAEANLASARAKAEAYRERVGAKPRRGPRPETPVRLQAKEPAPAPAPARHRSPPGDDMVTADRAMDKDKDVRGGPARRPGSDAARERAFDEAATLDVSITGAPDGLHDDDDEPTARASVSELQAPLDPETHEEETARLHLSELERLVAVSMDPELEG